MRNIDPWSDYGKLINEADAHSGRGETYYASLKLLEAIEVEPSLPLAYVNFVTVKRNEFVKNYWPKHFDDVPEVLGRGVIAVTGEDERDLLFKYIYDFIRFTSEAGYYSVSRRAFELLKGSDALLFSVVKPDVDIEALGRPDSIVAEKGMAQFLYRFIDLMPSTSAADYAGVFESVKMFIDEVEHFNSPTMLRILKFGAVKAARLVEQASSGSRRVMPLALAKQVQDGLENEVQKMSMIVKEQVSPFTDEEAKSFLSKHGYSSSLSGCFIATAAYGSYEATEVVILRAYRDRVLSASISGRLFIRAYYCVSPSIARVIRNSLLLRSIVRCLVSSLIRVLRKIKPLRVY